MNRCVCTLKRGGHNYCCYSVIRPVNTGSTGKYSINFYIKLSLKIKVKLVDDLPVYVFGRISQLPVSPADKTLPNFKIMLHYGWIYDIDRVLL
jgi:hypothetical protein